MKKFFLTLAAAATLTVGAMAQITVPSDLAAPMMNEDELNGWITYGNNAKPQGTYPQQFPNYEQGPWFNITAFGGVTAAYSLCSFQDQSESDQWLVSPEFTVTDDETLIRYEVVAFGTRTKTKFRILLSESGSAKEDFKTVVTESKSVTPSGTTTAYVKGFGAPISGYKGKKVRIAFINSGNKVGVLGFRNITVGGYSLTFDNPSDLLNKNIRSNDPYFSCALRASTPVMTNGIMATLETENGQKLEFTNSLKLQSSLATQITVKFAEAIDFKGKGNMGYTLTVVPNSTTEVQPTVVKGTLWNVEMKYDMPVVIEEMTGTWCQYCPYGAAYLAYYNDFYNGKDGQKKVIGMAAHSGDPMQVNSYISPLSDLASALGSGGLPSMIGNRKLYAHPLQFPITSMIDAKTFARAFITEVKYNPESSQLCEVKFNSTITYTTETSPIRASVIVLENGVKGNNSNYSQSVATAIANMTDADVIRNYGSDLLPYFKPFINLKSTTVPYSEMIYDDVVRNAFPSYEGKMFTSGFEAGKTVSETISFSMPSDVTKVENVQIVVLLTDAVSGEIVGADEIKYDEFNVERKDNGTSNSGVYSVNKGNASMSVRDGYLVVNADSDGVVTVYATDGRVLANTSIAEGENIISLNDFNGIVIVKATTASGIVSGKVIM